MHNLLDVRTEFLAHPYTIQNLQRDFHAWHLGRSRFAFWALDVDCAAVRVQMQSAQQHLRDYLMPDYLRQPHVTLGISGFLSRDPKHVDDYDVHAFELDVQALINANLKPFEIDIGVLNSFHSAPFYHVSDIAGSNLSRLNNFLHRYRDDRHGKYVPHVTVGLYAKQIHTSHVMKAIDVFAQNTMTRLLVKRTSLMSYAASEIGGELSVIADFDLEKAEINWRSESPFN